MMGTMTLPEFLLARYAEDEGRAAWYHRLLCMRTACDSDGCIWGEGEAEAMEQERVCNCGHPARIKAECEAKRRIVERAAPYAEDYDGWWARDTLRDLAIVYSDHPDYRPEWKP